MANRPVKMAQAVSRISARIVFRDTEGFPSACHNLVTAQWRHFGFSMFVPALVFWSRLFLLFVKEVIITGCQGGCNYLLSRWLSLLVVKEAVNALVKQVIIPGCQGGCHYWLTRRFVNSVVKKVVINGCQGGDSCWLLKRL